MLLSVFIHQSIFDDFVATATQEINSIQVGNGLDEATQMGPLIHGNHREGVMKFIEKAKRKGLKFIVVGKITRKWLLYVPMSYGSE